MLSADILDPFTRIQPGPFISRYSDWIIFTLLLFFFWAVAGIALKKRFEESRYFRVMVTAIALMLAVSTYYSVYQGWLHLSLHGLGFFGAILLFIVIFFIIFGMMRSYGMRASTALPLGLILFYASLWAVSPSILHIIQNTFPLVNGVFLIIFVVLVVKIVFAFFRHSKQAPLFTAKGLLKTDFPKTDNREIDQEMDEGKKEQSMLRKRTIKFTKIEIKSVDNIKECLEELIRIIKMKGNGLSQQDILALSRLLQKISKNENILKKGSGLIKKHLNVYNKLHRKDIAELEERLKNTKDKKKQKTIENEIQYQQKMLQALEFVKRYESKIATFTESFNNLVYAAMRNLKSDYPNDALLHLENAYNGLMQMRHIYKKEHKFEKYLLRLNKKTISGLKKEKGP